MEHSKITGAIAAACQARPFRPFFLVSIYDEPPIPVTSASSIAVKPGGARAIVMDAGEGEGFRIVELGTVGNLKFETSAASA